jgi:uncharacterized membrane protein YdjX (TVP38/TMEM64 family)
MEKHPTLRFWKRWSHWPAALVVGVLAVLAVWYATGTASFAVAVAGLLAFLTHGEARRYLRRSIRTPRPGRPWLARPAVRRRSIVILGLAGATAWYAVGAMSNGLTPESARSIVQEWGAAGPLLLIGLSGLAMLVAPVPNGPFAIAAGIIWGTWLGTLYALLGQLLGATLGFFAARYLCRRFLPRLVGERTATRIDELSISMGPHLVFWTRMAPFIPIDFTAYAAGLTAMRYRIYITAFMAGALIPTWIIVWVGDTLHESWTARILSFVALLAVLAVITLLYAYFNRDTLPSRTQWREWRAWRDRMQGLPATPGEAPGTTRTEDVAAAGESRQRS